MDTQSLHHVAIIPDGNRRWAKQHHLPSIEGHRRGAETLIKLLRKLRDLHIHTTTVWGFSTENWKRSEEEVGFLTGLFEKLLDMYVKEATENSVRLVHLGDKHGLPDSLVRKITDAEEKTKHFTTHCLNIAINYGGRDEIIRAIQKGITQGVTFTQESFDSLLDTGDQPYPNPDLIIRTSGEMRLSGLMPWQGVYAELYFLDKFFPDMTGDDLETAVNEYLNRQRRFGK